MEQQKHRHEEEPMRDDGTRERNELWMGLFGRRLKDKNWSDPLWVRPDDDEDLAY